MLNRINFEAGYQLRDVKISVKIFALTQCVYYFLTLFYEDINLGNIHPHYCTRR